MQSRKAIGTHEVSQLQGSVQLAFISFKGFIFQRIMLFIVRDETTKKRKAIIRDLVSEGLLTVALVVVLVFVLFSYGTVSWFAENHRTTATDMDISAKLNDYVLIASRSNEYDRISGGDPLYPGVAELKDLLRDDLGYSFTAGTTDEAQKLAFELVNEYAVRTEGVDEYFLMPGSYGTLTFYIQPRTEGAFSTTLLLDIGAFSDAYDALDNPIIEEVTNAHVLRLLEGHILFFTGRTGASFNEYRYSGLIEDGLIHFTTQGNSKVAGEDYYEVTLYWEWPLTYFEIEDNLSTTAPAVSRRFPAELRTYIDENRDAFFAANMNSNVSDLLNDGYNDADQIIGDGADYIVAFICNQ